MEIQLLGSMRVVSDDGSPVDCGGVKQRAVLAQLALALGETVSLDRLAEGIWGEQVPPRYRQNLQVYVSTLRRLLEPARPPGAPSRIVGHGEGYELAAATEDVDVATFRDRLAEATRTLADRRPKAAADLLDAALAQWGGDPLADLVGLPFAADWLEPLHSERLMARELLAEAQLAMGHHQVVIPDLEDLTRRHPEREHLWELLVTALARSGRQGDALEAVRRATAYLSDELGLDPGPGLADLQMQVLSQDPRLRGDRPPSFRVEPVPVPLSASVGRDEFVAKVAAALADHRLVVLTGPGGVGKTRTAQEVLAAVAADDTRWVPFGDQPGDVPVRDVVARTLGVPPDALDDELGQAPGALPGSGILLAMDNLEHVAGARDTVRELLERHPQLRVLATSRGPLGLSGEHVEVVPPLDPRSTAVDLFLERAKAAYPGYTGDLDRATLVELCTHLDGLPLAIELAAARITTLTPDQLLARLSMADDLRDARASGRQSSVSELVRWSLDLLDDRQRLAIEALAVLQGAPDAAMADAAVAAWQRACGTSVDDTTRDLESLVLHALVQPLESGSGRRFGLLHTVRSVCLATAPKAERATSADAAGPTDRHGADPAGAQGGGTEGDVRARVVLGGVADLWLRAAAADDGEGQIPPRTVAALQDELAILRQVVLALVSAGRPEHAARLLASRRRALALVGRQDVLLDLTSAVLADPSPGPWRAQLRIIAGSAAYVLAGPDATELLAAVHELADDDYVHRVLGHCFRAVIASELDDHENAQHETEQALFVAASSGNRAMLLRAHSAAAWAASARGDAAEVVRHGRAGLALAADDIEVAPFLVDMARGELIAGAPDRALPLAQEAVQRGRRIGMGYVLSDALQMLGFTLIRDGQTISGRVVLADAIRTFAPSDVGWQLETIAGIALATIAAGATVPGEQLLQDASRCAVQAGLGETAVPVELQPVADALGLSSTPALLTLTPTLAELRSVAIAQAQGSVT